MSDRPSLSDEERALLARISLTEVGELAADLVRAVGENPPGEEAATVDVLDKACANRGLQISRREVEPGRDNLSAVLPGGPGPGLLLLGHTDVVPVGEGWTVPPFGGVMRQGRLYGRGSADMKGGLAACVVAMAALRQAGVHLSGPVELAAVVDEEETGKGVRHYIAERDRSGFLGCIVAEPTDLQPIIAARGASYVQIGVRGRAAHAGRPSDGANAIYGAAAVISELERLHHELADRRHLLVGPATWSVGLVRGGSGASTVPAQAWVTADRRLLPGELGEVVLGDTMARISQLGLRERGLAVEARMTMEMPGFETPPDHPLVGCVSRAVQDAGGPDLPLAGWTAACDGGFVARDAGVPVVVLGAGSVADQAHRPDESVDLEDVLVAARAYALSALRLLR